MNLLSFNTRAIDQAQAIILNYLQFTLYASKTDFRNSDDFIIDFNHFQGNPTSNIGNSILIATGFSDIEVRIFFNLHADI